MFSYSELKQEQVIRKLNKNENVKGWSDFEWKRSYEPHGQSYKTFISFTFFYHAEKIQNSLCIFYALKTTLIKCLPIGENEINV